MKGTSEKSASRDNQNSKAPESDKPKTGKMKLIPEVVIERKVTKKPKIVMDRAQDSGESDMEFGRDNGNTIVELREDIPEWRRRNPPC